MTIQQHAEKFGARNTAQTLFRNRIRQFGLFTDDLPDTFEIADIIDSLEEAIGNDDREAVKEILSEVTLDWVGELIMS